MNDLEICKRIAEIEGLIVSNHKVAENDLWVHIVHTENSSVTLFDPLTDKALCFDLMVKHRISVEVQHTFDEPNEPDPKPLYYVHINCQYAILRDDPQAAICLAIIEANKE